MTSPGETSAAEAMARMVVFVNPFSANSPIAACLIRAAVSGEELGEVVETFFVERMFNIKRMFNRRVKGWRRNSRNRTVVAALQWISPTSSARALDVQLIGCMIWVMEALLADRADAMFHALADRTRRDILRRVMTEGLSVSDLASGYDMSFAAVQKHVAVLERAGLISKQRVGREQRARAEVDAIRSVSALLDELEEQWRSRVQRIDDLLAAEELESNRSTR